MTESEREARRRRLLERGSARLAFITGQARVLSDSDPATTQEEDPRSSIALLCENNAAGSETSKQQKSNKIYSDTVGDGEESESSAPKAQASDETVTFEKEHVSLIYETENEAEMNIKQPYQDNELESTSRAHGLSNQCTDTAISTRLGKKREVASTSASQRLSDQDVHRDSSPIPEKKQWSFSMQQINRVISDSENIRLLCAVTIAIWVVLSEHGYTLGGTFMRNIINFRPLVLVLLNGLTIILVLLIGSQETDKKDKERTRARNDEYGWADNIGKTLEALSILQKVTRAVFMDCSICAVIMISGVGI